MRIPRLFAAAAAVALAASHPASVDAQDTLQWWPYRAPTIIQPQNHVLQAWVKTGRTEVAIGGKSYPVNLYSASLFPPILHLEPGDEMHVRLANNMDPSLYSDSAGSRITNLHFHGFAVSPRQPGDDVIHTEVPIDSTYDYAVRIPADHAQGLFWYHPHSHPGSYGQVKAGMAGLITTGDPRRAFPEFLSTPEFYLQLKFFQPNDDDEYDVVNGVPRVELPQMRTGQTQFWRIANNSAERYYRLRLVGPSGDSVAFQALARDGNVVRQGPPVMIDQMLLGAGQRAEIIVRGAQPGVYTLVATDFTRQVHEPDERNPLLVDGAAVLARVRVVGPAVAAVTPSARQNGGNAHEAQLIRALVAARPESVVRDSIEFQVDRDGPAVQYPIDHAVYNPAVITKRFVLGQTYVWRIKNSSQSWHTFHIHQTDFLVDSVGGVAMQPDYRLDTVSVPPCQRYQGLTCMPGFEGVSVIRFRYDREDTVGEFVFHCHMLFHQDNGMMANVSLSPTRAASGDGGTAAHHQH